MLNKVPPFVSLKELKALHLEEKPNITYSKAFVWGVSLFSMQTKVLFLTNNILAVFCPNPLMWHTPSNVPLPTTVSITMYSRIYLKAGAVVHFFKKRMGLLFNLSFKMSNNRLLCELQYYHSLQEKVCLFSRSLSLNALCHSEGRAIQSLRVLHMSLRDSATAECFSAPVGGSSGIPVCGRGLLPGSPSICRLSQSCTLLPSLPPSPNLSLSAVTQQNITLSFSSALTHFVSRNKGTVCHTDDDWQGIEAFVVLILLECFWKWILAVLRAGHVCIWRLNIALSWKLSFFHRCGSVVT